MSNRHKVFVSYHHDDECYKKHFEQLFGKQFDVIVPGSVNDGDIDTSLPAETIRQKIRDEYLRGTSVTVVLVGALTWQRKHVDWEIGSSIRDTEYNPRSGLLGIVLPTHPNFLSFPQYDLYTIPTRLYDNKLCGFAKIYKWSDNPVEVQGWIEDAYQRKSKNSPNDSRRSFGKNRTCPRWTD